MSRNQTLREQYLNGDEIVVIGGPVYSGRKDGRTPVLYVPRHRTDPQPWIAVTGKYRYSSGYLESLATRAQVGRDVMRYGHTDMPGGSLWWCPGCETECKFNAPCRCCVGHGATA